MSTRLPVIEPRSLVHRGSVLAQGIAFEGGDDEPERRARILGSWTPGSRLLAFDDHWVVLWPRARRVCAERSVASPLVEYGSTLSTAPLAPKEAAHFSGIAASCSFVQGGRLLTIRLSSARELDPSEWLEPFEVQVATALAEEPSAPIDAMPERAASPREALGNVVLAPPGERDKVMQALATRDPDGTQRGGVGRPSWLRAVVAKLLGRAQKLFAEGSGSGKGQQRLPGKAPLRGERGFFQKLRDRFASWVWQSKVGDWLGQKHAAYLGRMMEMFERGDYEQALRHAIPTSKGSSGGSSAPALLPSGPRDSLALGGARGGGGTIGLQTELFTHLREIYRRAVADLERRGQILQAAFVLSELLEDDQAAVDFLERHGHLVEAARLAEARQLPPALIVRQWFLAGDHERALLVARRDNVFEDAVQRLKNAPDAQRALRLLWADHLAESGRYVEAVLVLEQGNETSELRQAWLDLAIATGGVGGARALALKVTRSPESFGDVRAKVMTLLSDTAVGAPAARIAFARALLPATLPEARALLRGVTRALVNDRARGHNSESRALLQELAQKSADGALQADLPLLPGGVEVRTRTTEARRLTASVDDRGPSRLADALHLPDGRVLVAKGEAGCFLLSRELRVVHHFDVPAHRLIHSVHGDRVLSLAQRDDIAIVSQIALASRRCQRWIESKFSAVAQTFDGSIWYVAKDRKVHALDTTSASLSSIWQSGSSEEAIVGIAVNDRNLSFLALGECWVHSLSPHRLTARTAVVGAPVLSPEGIVGRVEERPGEAGPLIVFVDANGDASYLPLTSSEAAEVRAASAFGKWVTFTLRVVVEVHELVDVRVIERSTKRLAANVRLEGTRSPRVRIEHDVLTVCDEHGRLVVLDLESGSVVQDVRI